MNPARNLIIFTLVSAQIHLPIAHASWKEAFREGLKQIFSADSPYQDIGVSRQEQIRQRELSWFGVPKELHHEFWNLDRKYTHSNFGTVVMKSNGQWDFARAIGTNRLISPSTSEKSNVILDAIVSLDFDSTIIRQESVSSILHVLQLIDIKKLLIGTEWVPLAVVEEFSAMNDEDELPDNQKAFSLQTALHAYAYFQTQANTEKARNSRLSQALSIYFPVTINKLLDEFMQQSILKLDPKELQLKLAELRDRILVSTTNIKDKEKLAKTIVDDIKQILPQLGFETVENSLLTLINRLSNGGLSDEKIEKLDQQISQKTAEFISRKLVDSVTSMDLDIENLLSVKNDMEWEIKERRKYKVTMAVASHNFKLRLLTLGIPVTTFITSMVVLNEINIGVSDPDHITISAVAFLASFFPLMKFNSARFRAKTTKTAQNYAGTKVQQNFLDNLPQELQSLALEKLRTEQARKRLKALLPWRSSCNEILEGNKL